MDPGENMAKTDVILIQNVPDLGGESDHLKVAAGFARNYLFPRRLAIPLTGANKRRIEVLRKRRMERESHELTTMTELAQTLSKLTLVIQTKTGDDGKLFGSVTAGMICDELKHQYDAAVDKKKLHLDHPIRTVGQYEVDLRLHSEVDSKLKIRVESTNPIVRAAEEAKAAAAATAVAKAASPAGAAEKLSGKDGKKPGPKRRSRE
jgi:large subunit ribosomal protein L9